MKALTAGYGSKVHQLIGRYAEQQMRIDAWNEKLLSNEKGILTNNTSGSLHYDDHRRMLDDVEMVRQYSPTMYDALVAAPGVSVTSSLFDTLVGYQDMNEFEAQTSMNVSDRKSNNTDYAFNWTPQPIYHCDFDIPWRQTGFSYKQGDGAAAATIATRLERDEVLTNGKASIAVNVNGVLTTLTGLTNSAATLLQPGSMTDWASPTNVATVYAEAVNLLATMFTTNRAAQTPGSVGMWVANDVWAQLELVASAGNSERTNLERIMALSAIRSVMPNQFLPDGSVLLVELTPTSIRIPNATGITVAPWMRRERFEDSKFTVFSASTLQVRGDRNGRSGVSFATKA